MAYEYIYTDNEDNPLKTCPGCGHDLQKPGSVVVHFSITDKVLNFATRLDENGKVQDQDELIANGYHSSTCCGGCAEQLTNFDSVDEQNSADATDEAD